MNIVFFTHPSFFISQSMPRFANFLAEGMVARGHDVEIWTPTPRFYKLSSLLGLNKWLGYIDQYIIFPFEVKKRLLYCNSNILFVFTDQAQGLWVPLVKNRYHVIHCHDFLAQLSALNEIEENHTKKTGKLYQILIRRGYSMGNHFISVSKKTKKDLHLFLGRHPFTSEIVYNGYHKKFSNEDKERARDDFGKSTNLDLKNGYILHVGGNDWYKNRKGVLEIYNSWRLSSTMTLPLIMIGYYPSLDLMDLKSKSPYSEDIHWFCDVNDELLSIAYNGANIFLFPSIAEGFGWPIAEAMASGCPVITTNEAPMTEVAGNAAFLIPRMPKDNSLKDEWAHQAAIKVEEIIQLNEQNRKKIILNGIENAKRFDSEKALNRIEEIYKKILLNLQEA